MGIAIAPPVAPAAPVARTSPRDAFDVALCAAAEALDVSPRGLRPVLAAVFKRMKESGLTVEAAAELADERHVARPSRRTDDSV